MNSLYNSLNVRSAAILTNSYVAGNVIGSDVGKREIVRGNNQLVLLVDFTKGSLTSAEIKIEYSDDGTNWYQEAFGNLSGSTDTVVVGEHSIAATGAYAIPVSVKSSLIRVSAKGTGTVTSSSMTIKALIGNV